MLTDGSACFSRWFSLKQPNTQVYISNKIVPWYCLVPKSLFFLQLWICCKMKYSHERRSVSLDTVHRLDREKLATRNLIGWSSTACKFEGEMSTFYTYLFYHFLQCRYFITSEACIGREIRVGLSESGYLAWKGSKPFNLWRSHLLRDTGTWTLNTNN